MRRLSRVLAWLGFVVLWADAAGQSQPASPSAFAVATIKPTAASDDSFAYRALPGGQLTAMGVTLKFLIMQAYQVRAFQVSGGPGWVAADRWDIQAKPEGIEGRPSGAQEAVMVRALLEDRFQLKAHRETKEMPVYALVVAKDGPKLSAAVDTSVHGGRTPPGAWTLKNVGTADLVRYLSQQLSRTVIDKTGLSGHYDVKLEWTPERGEGGPEAIGLPPRPDVATPPSTAGPSIFTAIQEQLGLKLESTKGPVEIVVIDHAEKPSAN
jgi:bla regulator protein BlaR1